MTSQKGENIRVYEIIHCHHSCKTVTFPNDGPQESEEGEAGHRGDLCHVLDPKTPGRDVSLSADRARKLDGHSADEPDC